MSADTKKVQFVCVRAAHHRHRVSAERLGEHLGCAAYCPAGDVADHDWMPTASDVVGLAHIGWMRAAPAPSRRRGRIGEPTDEDPRVVRTALDAYLEDFGHGEADLSRRIQQLVARLSEAQARKAG